MLEQPDYVLSTAEAQTEVMYGQYNFFGWEFATDMFHARVLHKYLARHLNMLIPAMEEEVHHAVDTVFGLDTENWKRVNVWDTWLAIVPFITNRMLVGYPLCRNKEFLSSCIHFTDDVVRNLFLIGLAPKILRPVWGPIAALPNWLHWKKSSKWTVPLIKQRIHDIERKDAGDREYDNWVEPEDFLTWSIRLAQQEQRPSELHPEMIAKRIMPIEFAATHTTTVTGHGVVLDLLASDPALGYLDSIREEAARVLREEGGHWTKNGLARLYRLDSAIRESMRVSNFAQTLVERKVVAREGITNKAEGWHVPYGGFMTLNLHGTHHDGDLFENPDAYDAFRYSRPREAYEALSPEQKNPAEGLRLKKLGMVTTGETHLPFGHGRHACPGRFFVAHELKMAIAHLVLNYDLKLLAERPKMFFVGAVGVPPIQACIEVKRKSAAKPADS
jgi:cytochrome P450